MATQVQQRRGTTGEHSTFTGAVGEITVDTTKDTAVVHDGTLAGGYPLVKESAIGVSVQAYDANTVKTNAVQSFSVAQRGAITALTDGATITADFAAANNFSVTLGGLRTLANPSNQTAGQSGCIWITQDGTGSRTLSYDSQWDFAGGTPPVLSTAAAAVDCLVYAVQSSTKITATLISNLS